MNSVNQSTDRYVLNVVVNDYESLEMVWKETADCATQDALVVTHEEVTDALLRLIRSGLVQAFQFNVVTNQLTIADPTARAKLEGLWFMATPTGVHAVSGEE
jgi:hypothetical protein